MATTMSKAQALRALALSTIAAPTAGRLSEAEAADRMARLRDARRSPRPPVEVTGYSPARSAYGLNHDALTQEWVSLTTDQEAR